MSDLRAALATAWRYPRPRLTPAHLIALRQGEDRLIGALKNGAPAATGTPPNPTAEKEPKDMHTLQNETTPRGRQTLAAITLAHLLEADPLADLPSVLAIDWRIDGAGRIHGHVPSHSDPTARAAVHAMAGFLGLKGVARSQGRDERSEWIHLSASGTYRGVPVNVWTHVAIRVTNPYGSRP